MPDYGLLDATCPIDWSHPLNRGLVGEWAVTPLAGWSRGRTLRDLVRGGRTPHDGTLTGMAFPATTASGWAGAKGRPGGFGSIAFDGTNDYVNLLSLPAISNASFSVAAWVYPTNLAGRFEVFCSSTGLGQTGLEIGNSNGTTATATFDNADFWTQTSNNAVTANAWNFIIWAADGLTGGNRKIYVNGRDVTSGGSGALATGGTFTAAFIGKRSTNSQFFPGRLDGIQLYNYGLTATVAAALYDETRRGNPDRWRWVRPWSFGVEVAAAPPPGVYGSRARLVNHGTHGSLTRARIVNHGA